MEAGGQEQRGLGVSETLWPCGHLGASAFPHTPQWVLGSEVLTVGAMEQLLSL